MGKLPAADQDNVDTKGPVSEKVSCLARITHRQVGSTHTQRNTRREADTEINRLRNPLGTGYHDNSSHAHTSSALFTYQHQPLSQQPVNLTWPSEISKKVLLSPISHMDAACSKSSCMQEEEEVPARVIVCWD